MNELDGKIKITIFYDGPWFRGAESHVAFCSKSDQNAGHLPFIQLRFSFDGAEQTNGILQFQNSIHPLAPKPRIPFYSNEIQLKSFPSFELVKQTDCDQTERTNKWKPKKLNCIVMNGLITRLTCLCTLRR